MKQLFRYAFGRAGDRERPARHRRPAREVPRFRLPLPRVDRRPGHLGISSSREARVRLMATRNELSRRTFLRGVGLSGAAIRVGLPAFEALFNASGTAYAAGAGAGRAADRDPVRALVQRQRDHREVLDPARGRRRLRDDPLPPAAGPVPPGHPRAQRRRQPGGPPARAGERAPQLDERPGLGRDVLGPRGRRPLHRPGDRPADRQSRAASARCRSASARSRSARASSAT